MEKRPALGKGLSALIPDFPAAAAPARSPVELDVDWLEPSEFQPRLHMDGAALDELAKSIVANGVIQPVVVRNVGGAGGRIGVNQLGEAPARDRLNIGFFTWNPVDQLVQNETLRVRYNHFKLIAGVHQATLLYIRRDTAPGITRPADVA